MSDAPVVFRRSIADHNRHCWFAAGLSTLGAWLCWLLFGGLYYGIILLLETVRTGDVDMSVPPAWVLPVGVGLLVFILVWASLDRWRRRFRPVSDRKIIGWHLFGEVLLAPARMTFSIWDHIAARVHFTPFQYLQAWQLLLVIAHRERALVSALGSDVPDQELLSKLLYSLQVTGWIDLHKGKEDWFYRVRSDMEPQLKLLESGAA